MAQKPDFYSVLGVSKTDSVDDINKVYKKKIRKAHPDRHRGKTPDQISAVLDGLVENATDRSYFTDLETYVSFISEAMDVIGDTTKRYAYDQSGHDGVNDVKNAGGSSTSNSVNQPVKPRDPDAGANYFLKLKADRDAKNGTDNKPRRTRTGDYKRLSRKERLARRNKSREEAKDNHTETTPTKSVQDDFDNVSENVSKTTRRFQHDVENGTVTLDKLLAFRQELVDMAERITVIAGVLDEAIEEKRRHDKGYGNRR